MTTIATLADKFARFVRRVDSPETVHKRGDGPRCPRCALPMAERRYPQRRMSVLSCATCERDIHERWGERVTR